MKEYTYTVIITHFGSIFWIRHTLTQIMKLGGPQIVSLLVIDQNRAEREEISELPGDPTVIRFPANQALLDHAGHDHPYVLNRAIRETEFTSSHIIVMDSDCFPVNNSWLEMIGRHGYPQLARDPSQRALTHPCFMVLPVESAKFVDFEQGLISAGIDSGRLVGLQLAENGMNPQILAASPSSWGKGHYYLAGSIYHHGSGSFVSSNDQRLRKQINEDVDKVYRSALSKQRLFFTRWEKMKLLLLRLKRRFRWPSSRRSTSWARNIVLRLLRTQIPDN